jgi:hypothetical protein
LPLNIQNNIGKIFALLYSDLESIQQKSLSFFGYRERMKLERSLFILLQLLSKGWFNFKIHGFNSFTRDLVLKKIEENGGMKIEHETIQQIFQLKFFLQSLSSDSAYIRGDALSNVMTDRKNVFRFIERQLKSIEKKIIKINSAAY